MRIFYTATALTEIDGICSYIERDSPIAAAEVAAAIHRTVDRLAKRPKSALVVHGEKVQAKLVERYQYRIFFEVEGDTLIIRNVRGTRRQRPWETEEAGSI
jgi:plasmid stabilization system protein ParE